MDMLTRDSNSQIVTEVLPESGSCPGTCFCQEDWFPTWGFSVMRLRNHRSGRRQFVEEMWSRFGKEHELFSTHLRSAIDELPVELQNDLYGF